MRLGVCTWPFGDMPLEGIAERAAHAGLGGVELLGDLEMDAASARKILADAGLEALSITPKDVDFLHPDASVREPAVEYYLRLLDWAKELGAPLVSCHGVVGRVRAVSTQDEEREQFIDAVCRIGERAADRGLRVAMELLNRYESHLLNNVEAGLRFVEDVGLANVGLLCDAYHMNIEESDLPAAIYRAGPRLFIFHAADSNRQAVGRGHIDFRAVVHALKAIRYDADIVLECVPPGPDPFSWDKGPGTLERLQGHLSESASLLKHYWDALPALA